MPISLLFDGLWLTWRHLRDFLLSFPKPPANVSRYLNIGTIYPQPGPRALIDDVDKPAMDRCNNVCPQFTSHFSGGYETLVSKSSLRLVDLTASTPSTGNAQAPRQQVREVTHPPRHQRHPREVLLTIQPDTHMTLTKVRKIGEGAQGTAHLVEDKRTGSQ